MQRKVVDGHQIVPANLGLSFGGFNCLVLFPTHFNSNNSVFKLLQILPLFMFTPGLAKAYPFLRVARARSQVDKFKFLRLIANISSFDNFLLQL